MNDRLPIVLIRKNPDSMTNYSTAKDTGERLRFPRQVGMAFSDCELIPGWKSFESFTCKDGTLKGVCYRLTVVRQFFKFAEGEGNTPGFALFFDKKLSVKFIERVIGDEYAKPKTAQS